ncbi:ABC transporter permease [Salipaludibacillus aurantiacus]|uniref:Osmoprotectant transport system permease protein n=1 Tax=Salipaludibacillus aurantiacus TaxID=1601833 RepID=A0A1H9SDK2_9BACI|nr:ABC transporter permease [Salipaludibacillus aurantiacus]SER82988.1 osmoprotectant transport system permease protein [Salipaludibacillus aurantiacus]
MTNKRKISTFIRYFFYGIVLVFFLWAFIQGHFSIIFEQTDEFLRLLRQHVLLVLVSSLLAVGIAIPAGILVTRPAFRKLEWPVLNLANLGQTIPSIAILALVMTYLGIGFNSAVFALFVFSILPVLRNTVAGLNSVDPALKDAAKGMGFTSSQILFKVEMPNAAYPIMAGIRTAMVMNVGSAALAYLVGGGGLGDFIFTGIVMQSQEYLISGAVPVTLLAICIDFLLRFIEKITVSKGLRRSAETAEAS